MNKKLFNRFNVIDIVLVIIALGLVIVAYLLFGNKVVGTSDSQKYLYQYELQNIYESVANNIKVGDKMYDNETNEYLGVITEVEINPYKVISPNLKDGLMMYTEIPDRFVALITLENDLIDTGRHLVTNEDYVIKTGKQIFSRGSSFAGGGYIVFIERLENNENN